MTADTTSPKIDLNCDLGEFPDRLALDDELAACVTSLNIACGGHAGDDRTMSHLVVAAKRLGRHAGAHPGYPDPANFGRVDLAMDAASLERSVREQIVRLARIASRAGVGLRHVKPHGALYHAAMSRREVAAAIAGAARSVDPSLVLVGRCGAPALAWWREMGRSVLAEAFADRRYEADGSLRPRERAGALIDDPEAAAAQAVDIAMGRGVSCGDGGRLVLCAGTICVHGDTPGAAGIARAVRRALSTTPVAGSAQTA